MTWRRYSAITTRRGTPSSHRRIGMTWSFQENKNPCKEGFLPMSVGNGLPGGRGMHAAPVCKVNPPVGQTFHFLRSGPTLATGRTQPTVIQGERPDQARDAMAERAFHAIRAFRFRQGVQPIGLTSIRTPARELIQRPFFLWQGNGRRYGPKASLMQRQRSTPVRAHQSASSREGFRSCQ